MRLTSLDGTARGREYLPKLRRTRSETWRDVVRVRMVKGQAPEQWKWSGKTLAEHKADRASFVTQTLAAVGISKPAPDPSRLTWRKLAPGDTNAPPRAHLVLHAISERITWRAEYGAALLAAQPPPGDDLNLSATRPMAA